MRKLIFAALLISADAFGNPFLIGDVTDTRADTCIYTRSSSVSSPVVVDATNGLPANGNRICKIDLASDPRTGTVTVALKDSIQGDTGPTASFTFGATLHQLVNPRLIP
jgi:hypothetical protein